MKLFFTGLVALTAVSVTALTTPAIADELDERGRELAQELIIIDTHIDVPYRLNGTWEDVTVATEKGEFDLPRARAGGLNIPFMSIYTPASMMGTGKSWQLANQLIDSMEALVARAPDDYIIVRSPAEARAAKAADKIGLALGMENGSPIENDLTNIEHFYERGIRYITLAHSLANAISDSSYDSERPNDGLSEFGIEVVKEMNRLGVMVDVSHVSDKAFWDTLKVTSVPVIASHSSARHFTPGFERNMDDAMIKALGENGGVIMINFGSSFISAKTRVWQDEFSVAAKAFIEANQVEQWGPEVREFALGYREEHPFPFASLDEVLDHFDHAVKLTGVDHVGIGSDYDGVGDSLPVGLKDVATFPALVTGLLRRGYSEEDIEKILGGNLLRVWEAVEQAKG